MRIQFNMQCKANSRQKNFNHIMYIYSINSKLNGGSHFTQNASKHSLASMYEGSNDVAKYHWSLDHTAENLLEGAVKPIERERERSVRS